MEARSTGRGALDVVGVRGICVKGHLLRCGHPATVVGDRRVFIFFSVTKRMTAQYSVSAPFLGKYAMQESS